MASREAERKRLLRAGYKHWDVLVHPKSLATALFAEGLITEAQLEDEQAQKEALSKFITRHCAVGRILKDRETELPDPKPKRPKVKRGIRWEKGLKGFLQKGAQPVSGWTPEDTEAWESGEARPHAFHWRSGYSGYWGHAGQEMNREDGTGKWSVPGPIGEIPPPPCERGPRGRSGDRDGRNRSRITGPGPSKSRASRKTIKPLTETKLKKLERPYADKLKVKNSSVHTVKTADWENRQIHGLDATDLDD